MTAELISFPQREASTFDDAWALVPMTMRRRSCKLELLRKLWADHGRKFGQQELLGSLKAYVCDPDFSRTGGQALERWLRAGRYEHFAAAPPPPIRDQFADKAIRAAVVMKLGEQFAILYLDPCSQDGTTLIARSQVAVQRMMEHRKFFKSLGYTGMKKKPKP